MTVTFFVFIVKGMVPAVILDPAVVLTDSVSTPSEKKEAAGMKTGSQKQP